MSCKIEERRQSTKGVQEKVWRISRRISRRISIEYSVILNQYLFGILIGSTEPEHLSLSVAQSTLRDWLCVMYTSNVGAARCMYAWSPADLCRWISARRSLAVNLCRIGLCWSISVGKSSAVKAFKTGLFIQRIVSTLILIFSVLRGARHARWSCSSLAVEST